MSLYDISESTVQTIIENQRKVGGILSGKNEVIDYEMVRVHRYPIKVVFSYEENHITVITVYPLKRGKNENNL